MDIMPRKFYLDDIFDEMMLPKKEQHMKCDIYEKDGNYHIEMDVPGFDKKDISIEANDGYLTITAEKNSEDEEKNENKNYIRRERVYGKVERSFYLGDLDQDKIDAEFKNGILNIVVPKKEETSNKKRIEIK
ncbi:MAG: Hsp20/alpha crystallin family protein [Tenericutes bacterium]|nr:Hsp20/alpha crystallin family protein [Mycoplasmatota bacterium]